MKQILLSKETLLPNEKNCPVCGKIFDEVARGFKGLETRFCGNKCFEKFITKKFSKKYKNVSFRFVVDEYRRLQEEAEAGAEHLSEVASESWVRDEGGFSQVLEQDYYDKEDFLRDTEDEIRYIDLLWEKRGETK